MPIKAALTERSNGCCELCSSTDDLSIFEVPPVKEPNSDKSVLVCSTCASQIDKSVDMDSNHWRCLNDSMWSQVPAVQVTAFRLLTRLSKAGESWAQDLLDMMYMEDEQKAWADYGVAADEIEAVAPTRDSNGVVLVAGDNVTLIKDLEVKVVILRLNAHTCRNISLTENPEHIEGRVNGIRIVLLTTYLKKMPLFEDK